MVGEFSHGAQAINGNVSVVVADGDVGVAVQSYPSVQVGLVNHGEIAETSRTFRYLKSVQIANSRSECVILGEH